MLIKYAQCQTLRSDFNFHCGALVPLSNSCIQIKPSSSYWCKGQFQAENSEVQGPTPSVIFLIDHKYGPHNTVGNSEKQLLLDCLPHYSITRCKKKINRQQMINIGKIFVITLLNIGILEEVKLYKHRRNYTIYYN